jgi:NAD-dependent SIR2 family protein deacetylase
VKVCEDQQRVIMTCLEQNLLDIIKSKKLRPIPKENIVHHHDFKCHFCKQKVYLDKTSYEEMKSDPLVIAMCNVCGKEDSKNRLTLFGY